MACPACLVASRRGPLAGFQQHWRTLSFPKLPSSVTANGLGKLGALSNSGLLGILLLLTSLNTYALWIEIVGCFREAMI